MSIKGLIKTGIAIGCTVLSKIVPTFRMRIPNRKYNLKILATVASDHPVYSKDTFCDSPIEKKVDVTLVIPFYCAKQEYIDDCLRSLINQKTKFSYTILCIEDGSKDDTLERLLVYERKYPELIKVHHQSNAGISCARNKGIQLANSNYIGFIDQDDWVEPDYIEKLMELATDNDADVVKSSHKVVQDGKVISIYDIPNRKITNDNKELILEYSGMIWSGFYKKAMFNRIRFPEKYWYEDLIARNLLYRSAKIFVSIEDALYVKRKHAENASTILWSGKNTKCYDHLFLLKHILEENDRLGLERDVVLQKSLLCELGQYLMWRTRGQKSQYRKSAFYDACYIARENIKEISSFSKSEMEMYRCLMNNNYIKWLIVSWKEKALEK